MTALLERRLRRNRCTHELVCEDQMDSSCMIISDSLEVKTLDLIIRRYKQNPTVQLLTELQYFRFTIGILLRTRYTTKDKYTITPQNQERRKRSGAEDVT